MTRNQQPSQTETQQLSKRGVCFTGNPWLAHIYTLVQAGGFHLTRTSSRVPPQTYDSTLYLYGSLLLHTATGLGAQSHLLLASSVSVGQSVTARFPHTASTWSYGRNIFLVIRWLGRKQLWDWRTQLLPGCTSRTAHTGPEGRLHFSTTVLQIQSHKCSSLLLLQVSPFSSFLSSPHLMSSLISNLLCNQIRSV